MGSPVVLQASERNTVVISGGHFNKIHQNLHGDCLTPNPHFGDFALNYEPTHEATQWHVVFRVQDRETTQPPVGRRLGERGPRLLECSDAERKYRQDADILSLEKRGAGTQCRSRERRHAWTWGQVCVAHACLRADHPWMNTSGMGNGLIPRALGCGPDGRGRLPGRTGHPCSAPAGLHAGLRGTLCCAKGSTDRPCAKLASEDQGPLLPPARLTAPTLPPSFPSAPTPRQARDRGALLG